MLRRVFWVCVLACGLYAARLLLIVLGRFVSLVPLWLSATVGVGLMVFLAQRRHARTSPVHVHARINAVPPRQVSETREVIDTDGEVVEERRGSAL